MDCTSITNLLEHVLEHYNHDISNITYGDVVFTRAIWLDRLKVTISSSGDLFWTHNDTPFSMDVFDILTDDWYIVSLCKE